MKKQGNFYTRLVLWILLALVVCYFGYYIYNAIHEPLTTALVIEYEAGSGSYTTGYVVREEHVLRARSSIATLAVEEGKRVSKDQTVATGYLSEDAQSRQAEIDELEGQLKQLEYACAYTDSAADQAALDTEIQARLKELSRYLARRDMNTALESGAALKGLVLRRMSTEAGDSAAMEARMEQLRQELDALRTGTSSDTTMVPATHSGYFSGTVDGYEPVLTPEKLDTLTVSEYESLSPKETTADEIGKIITGDTWYYVTVVDAELLAQTDEGDQIPVAFSAEFYNGLTMTVSRIGAEEDGRCLLVLSCDRYMQNVTLLRQQSADVVFSSYSGLRVPKASIRVINDKAGVFVVESNTAKWKTVEILYDTGESYVVALDKSSTDNLWPGDEIIVGAKDLYDGKVVR